MSIIENLQLNRLAFLEKVAQEQEVSIKTPHDLILTLRRDVFVPHIDTYQLIDITTDILEKHSNIKFIADIGTGSGVIAVTLASIFNNRRFFATDISSNAIQLAQHNASLNSVSNVDFVLACRGKWIDEAFPQNIGFIVSNPPYVGDIEYESDEFTKKYPEIIYEPVEAIRTFDPLGLGPYLQILEQSDVLNTQFYVFQCNADFIEDLVAQINTDKFSLEVINDKNKKNRFLLLKRR